MVKSLLFILLDLFFFLKTVSVCVPKFAVTPSMTVLADYYLNFIVMTEYSHNLNILTTNIVLLLT